MLERAKVAALLLLAVGFAAVKAQKPSCSPNPAMVTMQEGETAQLTIKCDKAVANEVDLNIFCIPGTATPGVDINSAFYQMTINGKQGAVDVIATLDADCNEGTEMLTCQAGAVGAVQLSGTFTVTIKECVCGTTYQSGNGATCDAPSTAAPTMGCWQCPDPQVWDGTKCIESANACPQPCPAGQTWQKGDGKTCANPQPGPEGYGCFPCPLGQFYNEIDNNCLTNEASCPTGSATLNGDPHYTTFDGSYYTIFPTGWFTVAKECKDDPTWEVCQETSNRCSGGAPTCSDGISIKIKCPDFTTTIKYNIWSNSYWFEGPTPTAEDAVITHSGAFFTVYLPKKKVTVKMYWYQITITLGAKWYGTGKVCGFFGDWDGNRANDFKLMDGTPTTFNSIDYIHEYVCQPTLPPPPPPPPTCDPGPRKDAAEAFCSVLHSNPGPYTNCHAKYPPGNTYELPIDTPYEQCVYDRCIVEDEGDADAERSACSDILAYANQCKKDQCNIGNPPDVCQPTCPAGKVYKACGPLVGPSCDNPDGVDGSTEGCYCPDGQLLTRSGDCVTTCPCTAYFEKNEIQTIEESGGFCVKLTRPGTTTTECPVTVTLDQQLSADATGTPAGDTCCGLKCPNTPVVCGGTTQCQITIPAGETEGCMWVKVDSDDTTEDRAVMLTTPDDRARVTIKSAPSENCFSFGDRIGFVPSTTRVKNTKLSLASPAPQDTCVTVFTIDGSAEACAQYQGGKYKGCFQSGSKSTNVLIPGVKKKGTGYSCFYTTAAACEGEPELEMCKYKYGFYYVAQKTTYLPRHGKRKQLCYARPPSVDGLCKKQNNVVRVTMLEELKPDECYVGYNAKVVKVYQGDLTVGQEATVWILPLSGCPDPDFSFSYGKDFVFAGSVDEDKLLVDNGAFLSSCANWEDLEDSLCP